jgi:hypothetical protein
MNRTLTRPSGTLSHPMGEGLVVRALGGGSGIERVAWVNSPGPS